ncbi:MAG TPA: phage major capsid protein [bacterium]|nr:phage major capsid protein [bacterium]HQO33057.1 phage major capsid protein [bacterium]HQP96900.1 phage major capsid protein [bacterium]
MLIPEEQRTGLPSELQRAAGIPLHPGLYSEARQRGVPLSSYLEELDPSGAESALDAFERQLALAGIKVSGPESSIIDRFFATQESAVLFPEFVARSVRIGKDDFTKLGKIVANRTRVDDNTYKAIYMDDSVLSDSDKRLAKVAEGAALPKIELETAEHSIQLSKYGRYLEATYEAIRRKHANVIAYFLRAVGVQIQRDKFADAIGVLINGDGNDNAASVMETAASGTLTYEDLVEFKLSLDPYEMNVLVISQAMAKTILGLDEFKEPLVAEKFQKSGEMIKLFGAEILVDDSVADDLIVGLDRRFALEEVYETEVMTESERLIRQQIEGTAISEVAGFAKLIRSACKVLDTVHT